MMRMMVRTHWTDMRVFMSMRDDLFFHDTMMQMIDRMGMHVSMLIFQGVDDSQ